MLPTAGQLWLWALVAVMAVVIALGVANQLLIISMFDEMRDAISIANRAKQCLEGRRTLGSQVMEDGKTWDILCTIKYVRPPQ